MESPRTIGLGSRFKFIVRAVKRLKFYLIEKGIDPLPTLWLHI